MLSKHLKCWLSPADKISLQILPFNIFTPMIQLNPVKVFNAHIPDFFSLEFNHKQQRL